MGNGPGVSVDYNISEPAVRWDSYESFNVHHEDSLEGGAAGGHRGTGQHPPGLLVGEKGFAASGTPW